LIEVEHLVKSYGQSRAVNDISFRVEKGEILGFLGPNGAGKTTTMRILAGYLPATSGTARIAGFDVLDQSLEVRRRIGYLPETPPLYPDMSVGAYLAFVARIKGVAEGEVAKSVEDAMRMAVITDKKDELIKRLSRGYKQRVGIAQAIIHKPDVIILDEPTVGLDPNQIKEVRSLVKNLAGQHTIILSTHILSEVEISCDRVVIIDKGRIADIDTTRNLAAKYKHGERLKIVVKGNEPGLRGLLESLEGINQVEIENDGHGQVGALVESAQGLDLRAPIAARIANAGFELLELRAVNLSLEDIFMRLTTKEEQEVKAEEPEKVEETAEAVEKTEEAVEPEKVETAEKAE